MMLKDWKMGDYNISLNWMRWEPGGLRSYRLGGTKKSGASMKEIVDLDKDKISPD